MGITVTADGLTKSRIYLAVLEAVLLYVGGPILFVMAATVQLVAEITDILDGRLARRDGSENGIGQVMDPAADAFLHGVMFYMFVSLGWTPVWLALIFFGRESVVAFYRLRLALRRIKLKARGSGKVKTVSQGIAQIATIVLFSLAGFGVVPESTSYVVSFILVAASAGITVYSFCDYHRCYCKAIEE